MSTNIVKEFKKDLPNMDMLMQNSMTLSPQDARFSSARQTYVSCSCGMLANIACGTDHRLPFGIHRLVLFRAASCAMDPDVPARALEEAGGTPQALKVANAAARLEEKQSNRRTATTETTSTFSWCAKLPAQGWAKFEQAQASSLFKGARTSFFMRPMFFACARPTSQPKVISPKRRSHQAGTASEDEEMGSEAAALGNCHAYAFHGDLQQRRRQQQQQQQQPPPQQPQQPQQQRNFNLPGMNSKSGSGF